MISKRFASLFQIFILIVSTIAIGWMLGGEVGFAEAELEYPVVSKYIPVSEGEYVYNKETDTYEFLGSLYKSTVENKVKVKDKTTNSDEFGLDEIGDIFKSAAAAATVSVLVAELVLPALGLRPAVEEAAKKAIEGGVTIGVTVARILQEATKLSTTATNWIGLGAALVVAGFFFFTQEDTGTVVVEYECQPWQAPLDGDCDACNDGDLPCNLYKCKSLGQSCELVNEGVDGAEICVDVNPHDVTAAIIKPSDDELTDGYIYSNYDSNPPSPGFSIISDENTWNNERPSEDLPEDGAIKAFDPLTFAIDTEEVTRCKIDTERDKTFDEMFSYMGGSSLYKKTHIENLILPNQEAFNSSGIELSSGELELYIICEDAAGNQNEIPYTVRMTIDPAPDTTPPKVMASSILTDSCVANGQDNVSVSFFINEYLNDEDAGCRWDYTNNAYENMANEMDCVTSGGIDYLSTCSATFEGIKAAGTDYYVKCKDNVGNVMVDPEVFSVRSSSELALKITSPENGTDVYGSISTLQVTLSAQTSFGCDSGLATCYYNEGDQWIEFAETGSENGLHTQDLYLPEGDYDYTIRCIDNGGNIAEGDVFFNVETTSGVVVSNFEVDRTTLSFETYAPSDCAYSTENCEFTFEEGNLIAPSNSIDHYFNYEDTKTYYIKCMDEYNLEPADCTIKIRPDDVL